MVDSDKKFKCIVTVQLNSATEKWQIRSITYADENTSNHLFQLSHYRKMRKICVETASKSGRNFIQCRSIVIDVCWDALGNVWVVDRARHYRNSKWTQHLIYLQELSLRPFIPKTDLCTKWTLQRFLALYSEVFIKPCVGQQGKGIVHISTTNKLTYEIHEGNKIIPSLTIDETYQYLEEHFLLNRNYVIQQKIQLATIDECPMDVRVITQKYQSKWIVTGILVKVAAKGYWITNVAQKLLSLEEAIQLSTISMMNRTNLNVQIDDICLRAAGQLEKNNTEINIIGFDIGIDHTGKVWIIEGNYAPNLAMFKKFKDGEIYKNIYKYKRA